MIVRGNTISNCLAFLWIAFIAMPLFGRPAYAQTPSGNSLLGPSMILPIDPRSVNLSSSLRIIQLAVTLKESNYPDDLKSVYRNRGFWEFPFIVPSPYLRCRLFMTNVSRHEERVDSVGNRWIRFFPANMEQPVVLNYVICIQEGFLNSGYLPTLPYSVPINVACYLQPTTDCDPRTPAARALAATLKGATYYDSIINLKAWLDTVQYGSTGITLPAGSPNSDATILTKRGVCRDQTEAAVALARAMGVAARTTRGRGHSVAEVWIPSVGWHEIQQQVTFWKAGWFPSFLVEPVDSSSCSPLLPWNMWTDFYISQFLDFYLTFNSTYSESLISSGSYNLDSYIATQLSPSTLGEPFVTQNAAFGVEPETRIYANKPTVWQAIKALQSACGYDRVQYSTPGATLAMDVAAPFGKLDIADAVRILQCAVEP